jgi:hypothetical protein
MNNILYIYSIAYEVIEDGSPKQHIILEFDFFYMGMKIQEFISQKQNKVAII